MMVETKDQYLDIFQGLKDELTAKEPPGYYDISTGKLSSDDEGGDDEFTYNEGQEEDNYDNYGRDYYYDQGVSDYCQALVPSPVPLDPNLNPEQS